MQREKLRGGGEGGDRGQDGRWHHQSVDTRRANSRRWWWTGKTDVLQSMGSQRVRHDLATGQPQPWTLLQEIDFFPLIQSSFFLN